MNQILDIQLHAENGYLIAVDVTVPVEGHSFEYFVPVEFITHNETFTPIEPIRTRPNTMFKLDNDGKYYYYLDIYKSEEDKIVFLDPPQLKLIQSELPQLSVNASS